MLSEPICPGRNQWALIVLRTEQGQIQNQMKQPERTSNIWPPNAPLRQQHHHWVTPGQPRQRALRRIKAQLMFRALKWQQGCNSSIASVSHLHPPPSRHTHEPLAPVPQGRASPAVCNAASVPSGAPGQLRDSQAVTTWEQGLLPEGKAVSERPALALVLNGARFDIFMVHSRIFHSSKTLFSLGFFDIIRIFPTYVTQ